MNKDKEIQIIAEELRRLAPNVMRRGPDGSFYLDPDDCRTIAVTIFHRLALSRGAQMQQTRSPVTTSAQDAAPSSNLGETAHEPGG
jgi:hypothetical protein